MALILLGYVQCFSTERMFYIFMSAFQIKIWCQDPFELSGREYLVEELQI